MEKIRNWIKKHKKGIVIGGQFVFSVAFGLSAGAIVYYTINGINSPSPEEFSEKYSEEMDKNIQFLKLSGLHKSQLSVESPLDIACRTIETGNLDVAIYNVNLSDEDQIHFNETKLEDDVNKAFSTLGINVNLHFKEVSPLETLTSQYPEDILTPSIQEFIKNYSAEFENYIRTNKFYEKPDKQPERNQIIDFNPGELVKGLDNYLNKMVGPENFAQGPNTLSNYPSKLVVDVVGVLANFKDSGAKAVPVNGSEYTNGLLYALVDTNHGLKVSSNKEITILIIHELGHILGLDHADNPVDVMSYSHWGYKIIEDDFKLAFSPESYQNWQKQIKKYTDKSNLPKAEQPKTPIGALQCLGNDREFKKFSERGYTAPPKVIYLH